MDKFLLLIDGSSLLTTQFFGNLPNEILFAKTDEEKAKYFYKIMQTSKGVYTNAVFGFMRALLKILKEQKPTHLAVAWDISRNTFRRELYPDYKGNRSETLAPLSDQFKLCQEVLQRIGVQQFMDNRFEADDFCGTLSAKFESELPVVIMTKDNDYLQLVSERTNLWMIHSTAKKTDELYAKYKLTKGTDVPDRCFRFTPELVRSEFGIEPASVPDLKGLQGDSSDNIKGVPGVGPATAVALIAHYGTVEALYEAMDGLDDKALKALAAEWKNIGIGRSPIGPLTKTDENSLVGREAAFLSKKLATIVRDIPMDITIDDLVAAPDMKELAAIFDELEFKTLRADIGQTDEAAKPFEFDIIDNQKAAGALLKEMTGAQPEAVGVMAVGTAGNLQGIAFTFGERSVYLRTNKGIEPLLLSEMAEELDKQGTKLCFFDLKKQLKILGKESFENAFDVSVADYLIDPLKGEYSACEVARRHLGIEIPQPAKSKGKNEQLSLFETEEQDAQTPDAIKSYAMESMAALRCGRKLDKELEQTGMQDLFVNIEMPLVYTLNRMEQAGIGIRRDELEAFSKGLDEDIAKFEQEIYAMAGEKFNINSPKQLGVILFEKLRLPGGKKTKTGYSTSADVLEKLKIEDPIVEKILNYRQLTKLKSTYGEGLAACIDDDGRIRTTFNQTVTATGRLSSTEPNLQNIPIRQELGRELRRVFAAEEGNVFVDADYSQIELRILASMSGDEKLIAAYNRSEDIHAATASAVFKVPIEEVTAQLRSRAKAVNFGIVYGISSFGLGMGLNISRKEADEYIKAYFETYPGIKSFLDGLVAGAVADGYTTTLFGRRRPVPELSATEFMKRQFGERIAMNSPIQGTAADIIKIAMIRVDRRLREECPTARLLLQVHDELLVEAPAGMQEQVQKILTEEMQGAAELKVSLEVGIGSGLNWYEAH